MPAALYVNCEEKVSVKYISNVNACIGLSASRLLWVNYIRIRVDGWFYVTRKEVLENILATARPRC